VRVLITEMDKMDGSMLPEVEGGSGRTGDGSSIDGSEKDPAGELEWKEACLALAHAPGSFH
jgi:hypothetical protein